ncbi:phage terminase large subunit family protein, partial [Escherichia coli]|nr:phage terminase large subunit family protein [Escherichia coli]
GSDYIREVNVVKSARVGYSKMLLGVYAYFIEHKQRNTLIWLPTDGDAENFMKTHVERKRLVRTVLIFTESSDQLSRATDRVPGL